MTAALTRLKPVWNDRSISLSSMIQLIRFLVTSISPVFVWIIDSHSRAAKKNPSHGTEVLPQDTIRFVRTPRYQRGGLCQDSAGNPTTRRPPDHRKETQSAVVWTCLPFIRSGQKPSCKAQWKEEEDKAGRKSSGKTTSGSGQALSSPSLEGRGEQKKWSRLAVKASNDPRGQGIGKSEEGEKKWKQTFTRY